MRLYRHLDMPSDGHMRLMKERFARWRSDPYWYVTVSCLADDARADQYRGYAEFWRRYDSWESTLIASRTRLGRRLSRTWWRLLFALDPPNRLERGSFFCSTIVCGGSVTQDWEWISGFRKWATVRQSGESLRAHRIYRTANLLARAAAVWHIPVVLPGSFSREQPTAFIGHGPARPPRRVRQYGTIERAVRTPLHPIETAGPQTGQMPMSDIQYDDFGFLRLSRTSTTATTSVTAWT